MSKAETIRRQQKEIDDLKQEIKDKKEIILKLRKKNATIGDFVGKQANMERKK